MEKGTTFTPACKCLDCGKPVDAATDPFKGEKPDPDDITICLYCGHIMAFADDLTLRALTDAEVIAVAGDPRIIAIQKARSAAMRDFPDDRQSKKRHHDPGEAAARDGTRRRDEEAEARHRAQRRRRPAGDPARSDATEHQDGARSQRTDRRHGKDVRRRTRRKRRRE